MKTTFETTKQWEEENWLRLLIVFNVLKLFIKKIIQNTIILMNIIFYLNYQVIKIGLFIIKLLVLTQPMESRLPEINRDESWIFRQIK